MPAKGFYSVPVRNGKRRFAWLPVLASNGWSEHVVWLCTVWYVKQ